jgi:hypothetical protein
MTRITIDVDAETLDVLLAADLREARTLLKADLVNRQNGGGCGIFSIDREEDIKIISEHIEAFTTVLKYYTPGGMLKEDVE